MKRLQDFQGNEAIVVAAKVLGVIIDILKDPKNAVLKGEKNGVVMFTTFMQNTPEKMKQIFAILSEKEPAEYTCNGTEAIFNMMVLANDPIIMSLFTAQSQKRDATSSGSASENTEA